MVRQNKTHAFGTTDALNVSVNTRTSVLNVSVSTTVMLHIKETLVHELNGRITCVTSRAVLAIVPRTLRAARGDLSTPGREVMWELVNRRTV